MGFTSASRKGGNGTYGSKAIVEQPLPPVAPAIANAVFDAIGVRIVDLPITSEKVLKALRNKQSCECPQL